jgi:L-alanine-DL-glutamate epimerase-like enolase superfamily enzyme
MAQDLSYFLGSTYRNEYPASYLRTEPKAHMPLCHLISAIDPIEASENKKPNKDKLPDTLVEWIHHNGLIEFKIKLNGDDLAWDVERMVHIDRVTAETQKQRGIASFFYVLDFNGKCPDVGYFLEFLDQLKQRMPAGYQRIRYAEQPTARDLKAHPTNKMHDAAKLCPVMIDESLTDLDSLRVARELGWTGAVVKSPKGLSNMILIASAAIKEGILLSGGDMSCPGAALIQTAGFQARVPSITSVEANARQYLPQANQPWEEKIPGMFRVKNGLVATGELAGPGLGA